MKIRTLKITLLLILELIVLFPIVSQVSCDPSDEFYIVAQNWEIRGIVDRIPNMRPYPVTVIKDLIEQAIDKGSEKDKLLAQKFYEDFFGKNLHVVINADAEIKTSYNEEEFQKRIEGAPSFQGNISFLDDFLTGGYKLGLYAATSLSNDFIPYYQNFNHDSIQDAASIGPIDLLLDVNTLFSVGTKDIFLQAGVSRSGYGSFINYGLAQNDSAYHSPFLTFHINRDKWAFSQQISSIGATTNSNYNEDIYSSKFKAFHSIDLYLLPKFSFSFYETCVFGRRFEFSYLLPSLYMVTQGISGCNDNIQMGLLLNYKPVDTVLLNADILVDDLSVNDIVKLNFDTKIRAAIKAGIIYTPEESLCRRLDFDYTMILPYMYSHWEYTDPTVNCSMNPNTVNYQNYTNSGLCMGSAIPPNSDSLSLVMDFAPVNKLNIQVKSVFTRHANIMESLTDEEASRYILSEKGTYSTDGSIFTHSMFENSNSTSGDHVETAWNNLNFLTQSHKMYIVQTGIAAKWLIFKTKAGSLSLNFAYTFEWVHNYGVDSEMYSGYGNYVIKDDHSTYTWNGTDYNTKEELESKIQECIDNSKNEWESRLKDVMSNYLTVGIIYKF